MKKGNRKKSPPLRLYEYCENAFETGDYDEASEYLSTLTDEEAYEELAFDEETLTADGKKPFFHEHGSYLPVDLLREVLTKVARVQKKSSLAMQDKGMNLPLHNAVSHSSNDRFEQVKALVQSYPMGLLH
jgi:hypothetical protein